MFRLENGRKVDIHSPRTPTNETRKESLCVFLQANVSSSWCSTLLKYIFLSSSSSGLTGSSQYLPSTKPDSRQQLTSSLHPESRKHNNELVVTHYFQHTSIKHPLLSPFLRLPHWHNWQGGKKMEGKIKTHFLSRSINRR